MTDTLEAANLKYHALPVAALADGRFAIFGRFTNANGLLLLHVCGPEALHELLSAAQADAMAPPIATSTPIDLDELLT